MFSFITFIFFGLGLIIGSFLNVVIYRFNTDHSFGGRSMCMVCQKKLSWYELIPLLSFLALRGRCLGCKAKISLQYPLVELATGILFAALFLTLSGVLMISPQSFIIAYAFYALLFSLLIVIAVYDSKHKIIPDALALLLGVISFIGLFFINPEGPGMVYPHIPSLSQILSGPILAAPFALLWLLSRGRLMGLGDAKLSVALGFLLGPTRLVAAMALAFWIGAIWGILLVILSRKHSLKSELPFAPFLVLGTLIAFLCNLHILIGF